MIHLVYLVSVKDSGIILIVPFSKKLDREVMMLSRFHVSVLTAYATGKGLKMVKRDIQIGGT